MKARSRRRAGLLLLQVGVSGLFIFLTLRRIDFAEVWQGALRVSLPILALSLLSKLSGFLFMTLRTRALARPLGGLGLQTAFRSIFVSFVGNNVLPFRLGELLRAVYLRSRGGLDTAASLALVFFERVLDTLALAGLLVLCLPLLWLPGSRPPTVVAFLAGIAILVTGLVLVVRHPAAALRPLIFLSRPLGPNVQAWIRGQAERFVRSLKGFGSFATVGRSLAYTLGFWVSSLLSLQIWIWAFGLELPWHAPLVLLAYVSAGAMLPAAPGFVGTYHFFLQQGLVSFGVDRELATAFAFVGHATTIAPFTLVGVPLVMRDILSLRAQEDEATPASS